MKAESQPKSVAVLLRRRQEVLREAASLWMLISGSFLRRFSTCSRPECRCHKGQRHGPRFYVVVTEEKAQRQHYVPREQVKAVQAGIRQYRRLLKIVAKLTRINLELMRRSVLDKKK